MGVQIVMGRLPTKKGVEGEASIFITRTQALRKLQISLQDFRKLCILKGVYPREPKTKLKGRNKTYYYAKDIAFLAHDPILTKLREQKTWRKRMTKAQGRKEKLDTLKRIEAQKPKYSLTHVIKERYPSFNDALRDLDDALCTVHLFAQLLSNQKIKKEFCEKSRRLSLEFMSYIIRARALRKVFISIKGIYYQAEIFGEKVTWIVPYHFCQEIPQFVDLHVMLNFLEFYETLMGFVNFKLFHSLGLVYPPKFDITKRDNGEGLFAVILEEQQSGEPTKTVASADASAIEKRSLPEGLEKQLEKTDQMDSEEQNSDGEESDDEESRVFQAHTQDRKGLKAFQNLFEGLVIYLSREVPKESLEFIIRCFGGKVSWEGDLALFNENDPAITHQIVDRDTQTRMILTRAYVQPQWIYDCVNAGCLLPVEEYGVYSKLPPHLSPFVDDEKEGYTPQRAKEVAKLVATAKGEAYEDPDAEEDEEALDSDDESKEAKFAEELQAERKGIMYSDAKQEKEPAKKARKLTKKELAAKEEEQRKEFAQMMIPSRKKRRLYERIQYSKQRQEQKNSALAQKAKLLRQKAQTK